MLGEIDNDAAADQAWALLALGTTAQVDLSASRIEDFIDADTSKDK